MKKENPMKNVEKVVVNIGIGRISREGNFEEKILPDLMNEIAIITGQKPETCPARKAIANFKTRVGETVGLKVTIRGKRKEDFIQRLIHTALPRVKDFRGIPLQGIDTHGNLNIGIRDQLVFPEINAENVRTQYGMQITIVPKKMSKEKARALYQSLGVPLQK